MVEPKPKTKLDALEDTVTELIDVVQKMAERMDKVEKTTVKKKAGLFGGKRERVAIKDVKTNVIYVSKAAVGKALAGEADTDPGDHFAWYKLQAKFPDRFIEASAEEKAKAEADEKAKLDAFVAQQNKEIAEKEAKEKAEAAKPKS